jgi:hypothetical protein
METHLSYRQILGRAAGLRAPAAAGSLPPPLPSEAELIRPLLRVAPARLKGRVGRR